MKNLIIFLALIPLFSCSGSPSIDFHSYQELSEYHFLGDGWFPEILNKDAYAIHETYDVTNKHLFGKFDFINRKQYDSLILTYTKTSDDSLINRLNQIETPIYPDWFLSKESINNDDFILATHEKFYIILEKDTNRIYFFR